MKPPPPPGTHYLPVWYIPRRALENRALALLAYGQPVLLWGPRDQGCTWLCHHLAARWRVEEAHARQVAVVDFRRFGPRTLGSLNSCLLAIAATIEDWLADLAGRECEPAPIAETWSALRGDPITRLNCFVRRTVLPAVPGELLLVFDHADLVHLRPFYEDLAGMLRSWAEKAMHSQHWAKLRLLVSVSVHPARLSTAQHQSPFANLSDPIQIGDFDRQQIAQLAQHHDLILSDRDIERIMGMVGGHPYLARAVLWDIRDGRYTIDDLTNTTSLGRDSLIADYLQRDQCRLNATPALGQTFTELVAHPEAQVAPEPCDELIRLGLIKQGPNGSHPLRYPLFARLLEQPVRARNRHKYQLFYIYADADEKRRHRLETHLRLLEQHGLLASWHHRCIPSNTGPQNPIDATIHAGDATIHADDATIYAGDATIYAGDATIHAGDATVDAVGKASRYVDDADVILFLVSVDFLTSPYSHSREVKRALQRHERGDAIVLAIILRSCDWEQSPLTQLQPLPRDGFPVTRWTDEDDAWADVTQAIRCRLDGADTHSGTHNGTRSDPNPTAPARMQSPPASPLGSAQAQPQAPAISANGVPVIGNARANPCTILFLSANPNPGSPLAIDREYRRIASRLETSHYRDHVRLIPWHDVHTIDLPSRLRREQPDIVHFSGHGLPDGTLLMRDKLGEPRRVNPRAVAGFIVRRSNTIRMVVLNACYSQALAEHLREHIPCVIGMATEVTDNAAITFAETLYEALFDNESLQTAVADSCDAITAEGSCEGCIPQITSMPGLSLSDMRLFSPMPRSGR